MLFLYCGDMLKQEKYHKGVDFFEKAALSVEQECSFVKFSGIDDVTVRQEWGYAMEDTKRSNKKFHMNIVCGVAAWFIPVFACYGKLVLCESIRRKLALYCFWQK